MTIGQLSPSIRILLDVNILEEDENANSSKWNDIRLGVLIGRNASKENVTRVSVFGISLFVTTTDLCITVKWVSPGAYPLSEVRRLLSPQTGATSH